MAGRFVLEGEWSGYRPSQCRVVHREVVTGKRAERLKNLSAIQYTDGTTLILRLRPAEFREQIKEIRGYTSLIREAEATGQSFVRVADLADRRKAS